MLRIELHSWNGARALAAPIRVAVFVEEQGVPRDIELDERDAASLHALAFDGEQAVATGRLLPDGHIGRMAVLKDWRGKGIGSALLLALIAAAERRGDTEAALSAQAHAVPFYRAHGFAAQGAEYMEAGIPHLGMTLALGKLTLAEAARQAVELAPVECLRGPWGAHCMAMHAVWSALRLIGHVGGPAQDAGLYVRAMASLPNQQPEVLVSGASDHGILEQVLQAAGTQRSFGSVTVLDRCDTPLHVNRWYAKRVGQPIDTHRSDIVDYAPGRTFDAVFAHSFLEHLPRERWGDLARTWQKVLRPGGLLAVVFRVRSEGEAKADVGSRREPGDFLPFLERANAALPAHLRLPAEKTAGLIAQHWRTRATSPVRSPDEVLGLLSAAGIEPMAVEEGSAFLSSRPGLSTSKRLRVLARRKP